MAGEAILTFSAGSDKVELFAEHIREVEEAKISGMGNSFILKMTDAKGREFRVLTERLVGKPMNITLCGRLLFAPVVNEPISGRAVMLPASHDLQVLQAYEKLMKRDCR